MIQLEIIHLRSSENVITDLVKELSVSLEQQPDPETEVTIYQRKRLKTDIAIHIRHQEYSNGFSSLGHKLAAELKQYGIVEHTLWEASP